MPVDYEIRPSPAPQERAALVAGLERLLPAEPALPAAYRSRWRHAGIAESTSAAAGPAAAAPPRPRRPLA